METQPRIQRILSDNNGDGTPEALTTLILDENGNQISKYIDNNFDGKADYILNSTYAYDEIDNLTITYLADNNGDGDVDIILPYVFNVRGDQLNRFGPFGSSVSTPTVEYSYDDDNNLVEIKGDLFDRVTSFTYDASGNETSEIRRSISTGQLLMARFSEYDEKGSLTRLAISNSADGVIDFSITYAYTYDENDNILSKISLNSSGNQTEAFYTYDDAGNLVRETSGYDGFVGQINTYTYDSAGNLLREVTTSGDDRLLNLRVYTYDDAGNRTSESVDFDGDGAFDRITTTTYPNALAAPIAADDSISAVADIISIGNLFNDNGNGVDQNPDNTLLQLTAVNGEAVDLFGSQITLASGATLSIRPSGDFVYNPNGAFAGLADGEADTDSFSYTVSNGVGGTDTATVEIALQGTAAIGMPILLRQTFLDQNADGIPDSITTYTYDANGNRTRTLFDRDGDGMADSVETKTYDSNNDQTSFASDNDADGQAEFRTTATYDDAGNLIRSSFDNDGDGEISAFVSTYTYDGSGNLLQVFENNEDETPELVATYTYDNSGNRTSDRFGNSLLTRTFDAFGNQTSERTDYEGDGIFDFEKTANFVYDAEGRLVSETFDLGDDGTVEQTIRYSPYQIDTGIGTEFNDGFFGNLVYRGNIDVVYDEQGQLSAEYIDSNEDGVVNQSVLYDYSETGRSVSRSIDFDDDGRANQIYTETYDLADNLLSRTSDSQADGIDVEVETFTYDEAGNLLRQVTNRGSGTPTITVNTYDEAGNQTSFSRNFSGREGFDYREVYTYDEFGNQLTSANVDRLTGDIRNLTTNLYTGIPTFSNPAEPSLEPTVLSEDYTYDVMGNLTITYAYDRNADAIADSIFAYTFNTNGSQINETRDYDANGTIDFVNGEDLFAIAPQSSSFSA